MTSDRFDGGLEALMSSLDDSIKKEIVIYDPKDIKDAVLNAWTQSELFKMRLLPIIRDSSRFSRSTKLFLEPRFAGTVAYFSGYEPELLLAEKVPSDGKPFYECTFTEGIDIGIPHNHKNATRLTSIRGFEEEISGKRKLLTRKGIITSIDGVYICLDKSIPVHDNSDIFYRRSYFKIGSVIKKYKVLSLLSNGIYLASKKFDLFEENPDALEEHRDFKWVRQSQVKKYLIHAASLGRGRGLNFYNNFIRYYDFEKMSFKGGGKARYTRVPIFR